MLAAPGIRTSASPASGKPSHRKSLNSAATFLPHRLDNRLQALLEPELKPDGSDSAGTTGMGRQGPTLR
jgi:hypothetical protein